MMGSMKLKTIKLRHDVDLWLQVTATLTHGRAVVNLRRDDGADDGSLLTSGEARRLAAALNRYADLADEVNGRKPRARLRDGDPEVIAAGESTLTRAGSKA
jgi:hypothetical protein